ncbi:MAG: hypothetical protein DCE90_07110 [Pseudanabaena sp.]|nr:MAG: hypothetical protein DCE90_07110 [Pseudanabaena sp.]
MKKSFIYRSLQAAVAVATCALMAMWVSTSHDNFVLEVVTELDSLAVILAIAVALPYICFKALSKLYTPPVSRKSDKSDAVEPVLSQDELAIAAKQSAMQYRGNPYVTDAPKKDEQIAPVAIKYRGANIDSGSESQEKSGQDETFFEERQSQKSAKPKERIKYRGAYVD